MKYDTVKIEYVDGPRIPAWVSTTIMADTWRDRLRVRLILWLAGFIER